MENKEEEKLTLLADAATMIAAGPSAATQTASIAAAGPIQDMVAHLNLYQLKLKEIKVLLTLMKGATDAGDSNLTIINSALSTIG